MVSQVMKGFGPLNDISKQLNTTFSGQIVIFMVGILLMGIYTCLGLYKYSKVVYDYVKWYLYISVTSHVTLFLQSSVNSASSRRVSFLLAVIDNIQNSSNLSGWRIIFGAEKNFQPQCYIRRRFEAFRMFRVPKSKLWVFQNGFVFASDGNIWKIGLDDESLIAQLITFSDLFSRVRVSCHHIPIRE